MRNLLWAICLAALLSGCNNSNSSNQASGQPNTQQQNQRQVPITTGY